MGDSKELGRIEKKPVREYWENEASDFTPWLAKHIDLLGEEIGMGLEVEEHESNVGDFRVDLLCKDENERTVIVENQLEKTDHRHLGQLLTYAAGKDAVGVVWVSTEFTDEHRAAMDWLNDKTGEGIQFFGVQIEIWQIGDSAAAPKFEVVCKPNQWTKSVQSDVELSGAQKLRFDYWSGLHDYMQENGGNVKPQSPAKHAARWFPLGVSGIHLMAAVRIQKDFLVVRTRFHGKQMQKLNSYYRQLHQQKDEIEKEIGAKLEWRDCNDAGQPVQLIRLLWENCNFRDKKNWGELHRWHHQHLEKFHAAFRERVQKINPDDWSPDDDDANGEED